MLTPQEIKDKQFVKSVFGGYDMSAVDDFLEEVEDTVTALGKENATLKSKMKLLVEKIEEYQTAEDSLRRVLVEAKKTADQMVDEAKKNSESMVRDAELKSRSMIAAAEKKSNDMLTTAEIEAQNTIKELDSKILAEDAKLQEAKKHTEAYVLFVSKILNENVELLKNLDKINAQVPPAKEKAPEPSQTQREQRAEAVPAAKEEPPAPVQESKTSIEDDIFASVEKNIAESDSEPAVSKNNYADTKMFDLGSNKDVWDDVDEPTSPHPKFDFSDLRFGSNYFGELDDDK